MWDGPGQAVSGSIIIIGVIIVESVYLAIIVEFGRVCLPILCYCTFILLTKEQRPQSVSTGGSRLKSLSVLFIGAVCPIT